MAVLSYNVLVNDKIDFFFKTLKYVILIFTKSHKIFNIKISTYSTWNEDSTKNRYLDI